MIEECYSYCQISGLITFISLPNLCYLLDWVGILFNVKNYRQLSNNHCWLLILNRLEVKQHKNFYFKNGSNLFDNEGRDKDQFFFIWLPRKEIIVYNSTCIHYLLIDYCQLKLNWFHITKWNGVLLMTKTQLYVSFLCIKTMN